MSAKRITISVSGLDNSPQAEKKCRSVVQPFIDSRDHPEVEITFNSAVEEKVTVKIEVEGLTLLKHPRMLEPSLADELTNMAGFGKSTQFHHVPGESETTTKAVVTT